MSNNPLPGIPLVESPLFRDLVNELPEAVRPVATELHEKGFAVVDFPEENFDVLAAEIIAQLEPKYDFEGWRRGKRTGSKGGLRIQDGTGLSESVLKIACNRQILDLLSLLYGRKAFPFQTLNFPVGSEQHFHTDSLHFSSLPERFMCGVWVAFEDVGPEQGPLEYYPGSHRFPVLYNEHYGVFRKHPTDVAQAAYEPAWEKMVRCAGMEPEVFCPKKGQALIWAANLLHGGSTHNDPGKTRWSQVTHYYFEDCAYVTPVFSQFPYGRYRFKTVTNLVDGTVVPHRYMGAVIPGGVIRALSGQGSVARTGKAALPPDFDKESYLRLHPDVKNAGVDAAEHFLAFGFYERRRYK